MQKISRQKTKKNVDFDLMTFVLSTLEYSHEKKKEHLKTFYNIINKMKWKEKKQIPQKNQFSSVESQQTVLCRYSILFGYRN